MEVSIGVPFQWNVYRSVSSFHPSLCRRPSEGDTMLVRVASLYGNPLSRFTSWIRMLWEAMNLTRGTLTDQGVDLSSVLRYPSTVSLPFNVFPSPSLQLAKLCFVSSDYTPDWILLVIKCKCFSLWDRAIILYNRSISGW